MLLGVPRETARGETRVSLTPEHAHILIGKGFEIVVERDAGGCSGFSDRLYADAGARIVSGEDVFADSDILARVNAAPTDILGGGHRQTQSIVGLFDPLTFPKRIQTFADRQLNTVSMELIPRISRAQSMDALSSMATIAGYKSVLLAACRLPRMFPMFMTAAGTIPPARVFVIGAGVAGLQAIATAKRLGAKVRAYDVRPVVADQVQSVGGTFVQFDLDTAAAEGKGGYAANQNDDFLARQRELMAAEIAASDVVITTAAIPGRTAPVLVTADMVHGMNAGSVIVDLAAGRGGNCELSAPDEDVCVSGVHILGPTNLPATVPQHASQLYGKNVVNLLTHLRRDDGLALDDDDEIIRNTVITRGGEVVHPRILALLNQVKEVN